MSVIVNERAAAAVHGLRQALIAGELPEVEQSLRGIGQVEDRAALGAAADLFEELARMFADLDPTVEEAARHAYQVFADQAGRPTAPLCVPCSVKMCGTGLHTSDSHFKHTVITENVSICGCSCLRRKR